MKVYALTGSIGMGKSTTAAMFRELGVPVHDADAAVHELYAGRAVPVVEALFPGTTANGVVDRTLLSARVIGNEPAMRALEAAIHPMVREEEAHFLRQARAAGAPFVILDIPLLFEKGGEKRVDGVIVVTADAAEQRRRVLARPGMTAEKFEAILARQTPDAEKRARADFIVTTDAGLDDARRQVAEIVRILRQD
jgi:dephospho-CoA kinase